MRNVGLGQENPYPDSSPAQANPNKLKKELQLGAKFVTAEK